MSATIPPAQEIAETTIRAANHIRRFGIEPKAALVSHSNFGSRPTPSALKMRKAFQILQDQGIDFECDGEMHADVALSQVLRDRVMPDSHLKGEANLLVLPNLDAANIALNMTKVLGEALHVGPILIGPSKPAHVSDAIGHKPRRGEHDGACQRRCAGRGSVVPA
jgi:malate dehydrogenase (oxaloacetate-decarboxylating)(NADP+)